MTALVITKGAPESRARPAAPASPPPRGRRWRRSSPPATASSPSPPGRPPASVSISAGRRDGLTLARLPGLPRPAEADAARRAAPARHASASRSRSSPATTPPWPPRSAPTSACRPARCATGADIDSADDAARRPAGPHDGIRPGQPGAQGADRPRAAGAPAPTSPSSATASTTRWRCTPPTSASPSTRPPTWPRTPPTSCCWRRTWTCSPTASPRAGGSSPTPSSTC